jgi:hypothetical protein
MFDDRVELNDKRTKQELKSVLKKAFKPLED